MAVRLRSTGQAGAGLLLAVFLGCSSSVSRPIEIPLSELAAAEPALMQSLGRARVPFDRPLPAHLILELSPEFSLVQIANPSDWEDLRRRFDLAEPDGGVDLSQGAIVGLLAEVGERAERGWPIQVLSVRTNTDVGWIEASFSPGLYYPLRTAGYLELVFVPGLRKVGLVRVDSRAFLIGSAFGLN